MHMLPAMKEQHVLELCASPRVHEPDRRGHATPKAVAKIHPDKGTGRVHPCTLVHSRAEAVTLDTDVLRVTVDQLH